MTRSTGRGRGFASKSEEQRRVIASRGGKSAQASGNAHRFTVEESRDGGRKGGLTRKAQKEAEAAKGCGEGGAK